ncbi:uncharacterized protein LOC126721479 [Quercus robur]|uniref:uncharacterized protein LOC126721479 n=1 Tax=Quercus robur TaxID=38942 RepID=UPI002161BFC2|nr:uncharacterized protein LOC126721479 [Quercus robur]
MIAWCIWVRRNKLREKLPVWAVGETARRAWELLQEYWDVQDNPSRTSVQRPRQKWSPPELGVYKLNFDGAIFESSARAGLGVVVRDAEGMIIAALSQNIKLPSSVDLVEALAARRAILFAQELCLGQVMVEGDSLRVITAINNPQKNRTQWGHVVEDIKKASSWFQTCSFGHIYREGNSLAHSLAKRAVLSADLDVWLEDLPQDLIDVFQSDLS